MIKLVDVCKKFADGTSALTDISFEIADGEFVFLVGSSGAGKTTLLRLFIRDHILSSGTIVIDGKDLAKMKNSEAVSLRRQIGFVFQDLKLLTELNLYENVALSLEIMGKPREEIKKEVNQALDLVGLAGQGEEFPLQMSGGELQRVAIARAIVGNPKYVFADEPTGNVDPAMSWNIIKILETVNKTGATVIMATHNSEIVDSLGKRVIRLENGRVVSDKKGAKYR